MGRCHEFGLQIHDGCGHPMVAGENACACSECGTGCGGRFAGCPDVWARGPQPVSLLPEAVVEDPLGVAAPANGDGRRRSGSRPPAVVPATAESATGPETAAEDASAAAVRWLEAAFAGLRVELQTVRSSLEHQHAFLDEVTSGMTRQQALLDELLAATEGNARLKTVAQSLPGLVGLAVTRAVEASETRTAPDVDGAIGRAIDASEARSAAALGDAVDRAVEASESRAVAVIETAVGRAADAGEMRAVAALDDAVDRAVVAGEARTMAALKAAFTRAVEQSEVRAAAALDAAVQRAVEVTEERTLAVVEEAVGRAVEAALARRPPAEDDLEAVGVGVRALMESDPATGSVIAAIATQAANQSVRSEIADQLPETVEKVLAGSDARLEHLVERMEKVVARAARLASPPAAPSPPKTRAARATKKTTAAPAKAPARATKKADTAPRKVAARKTAKAAPGRAAKMTGTRSKATKPAKSVKPSGVRQPRKATRTSSQGTRPSRRSLGS